MESPAPNALQVEIDILRERLDLAVKEKSRLVVDQEAVRTLTQQQSRELVQLRAEVDSRRKEVQDTVRRAAQAMQELDEIIQQLHRKVDSICELWAEDVRKLPWGKAERDARLGVVASFRAPAAPAVAEG